MNQSNSIFLFSIMILLAAVLQFFLPWWTMAISCAMVGFAFGRSGASSFSIGFLSIALLWTGTALWINKQTGSGLPDQIGLLFPGKSMVVLYVLTALVGGLTGGSASLTGYLLRKTF